jgi:hypothetical protein
LAGAGGIFGERRLSPPSCTHGCALSQKISLSGLTQLASSRVPAARGRSGRDITQAILDGHQPPDLTADKLLAHSRLPLAWPDQRTALGFA